MGDTVVRRGVGERALVGVGFPVLGVAVLLGLSVAADWLAGLPWVPWQGPIRLVASVPEPYATLGAVVLGALAGGVLALVAAAEAVTVRVGDEEAVVQRDKRTSTVRRGAATAVFVDGKDLVVLGADTAELVREHGDLSAREVGAAFVRHGWPWRDGDPHDYQRWVDDLPELSASAHALLRARARAVDKGDRADADDLRAELGRHGVVVRDTDKRQYWRRTG